MNPLKITKAIQKNETRLTFNKVEVARRNSDNKPVGLRIHTGELDGFLPYSEMNSDYRRDYMKANKVTVKIKECTREERGVNIIYTQKP